ncbi:MAG: hypothetical protein RBU30_15540 [Polyangia bacterium]|nr:hypothetical protein [Polyangia bacterium]
MSQEPLPPGPFDELSWPSKLTARVVSQEDPCRIHGYAVEEDLARHYSLGEVMLLALTGRIPSEEEGAFFEAVLLRLGPVTVAEAPVHAAMIARSAGSKPQGTLMVGLVGLVEQARHLVISHSALLEAFDATSHGEPWPPGFEARCESDRAVGIALEACWPRAWPPAPPLRDLRREAALLFCLAACGLTKDWQLETALVAVRLPILAAEVHSAPLCRVTELPLNLPPFEYEDPHDH